MIPGDNFGLILKTFVSGKKREWKNSNKLYKEFYIFRVGLSIINFKTVIVRADKSETEKEVILTFFDNAGSNYWKTLDEISSQTHVDPNVVMKVITNSGDFVRSSYRKKAGEPLFTSRRMFRNRAPIVDKIIGSFKNRID